MRAVKLMVFLGYFQFHILSVGNPGRARPMSPTLWVRCQFSLFSVLQDLRASPIRSLGFTIHGSLPHQTQHRGHFWSLWPHPEKDAQRTC